MLQAFKDTEAERQRLAAADAAAPGERAQAALDRYNAQYFKMAAALRDSGNYRITRNEILAQFPEVFDGLNSSGQRAALLAKMAFGPFWNPTAPELRGHNAQLVRQRAVTPERLALPDLPPPEEGGAPAAAPVSRPNPPPAPPAAAEQQAPKPPAGTKPPTPPGR